jgi:hypothetical protein
MNTPKKLDLDSLAALFVNRAFATGLPDEALKACLDALTLWVGIQAEYDIYARHQNMVAIRPDDIAQMMPAGAFAALPAETRKRLRAAIREKERCTRQGLAAVRQFIHTQAGSRNAGSVAFQQVYAERLAEYLTEPLNA